MQSRDGQDRASRAALQVWQTPLGWCIASAFISLSVLCEPFPAGAQNRWPSAGPDTPVIHSIDRTGRRVQHLLGYVRLHAAHTPDVVVCVDQRLSQIHALMRLAMERRHGPSVLLSRRMLQDYAEQASRLEREALACAGRAPMMADETIVTVLIEPGTRVDL